MYNQPFFGAHQQYQQPPSYGYHPNMGGMQYPHPPPPNMGGQMGGGQTVIQINDNSAGTPCQHCACNTSNIPSRTFGLATCAWCLTLSLCGLCFIPCCMDGCKDV